MSCASESECYQDCETSGGSLSGSLAAEALLGSRPNSAESSCSALFRNAEEGPGPSASDTENARPPAEVVVEAAEQLRLMGDDAGQQVDCAGQRFDTASTAGGSEAAVGSEGMSKTGAASGVPAPHLGDTPADFAASEAAACIEAEARSTAGDGSLEPPASPPTQLPALAMVGSGTGTSGAANAAGCSTSPTSGGEGPRTSAGNNSSSSSSAVDQIPLLDALATQRGEDSTAATAAAAARPWQQGEGASTQQQQQEEEEDTCATASAADELAAALRGALRLGHQFQQPQPQPAPTPGSAATAAAAAANGTLTVEAPAVAAATLPGQATSASTSGTSSFVNAGGSPRHLHHQQQQQPQQPQQSTSKRHGCEHDAWWRQQRRHVFVLSSAGKPVFSLHGDENSLAGLMGVLQAIISVVQSRGGDSLRSLEVGGRTAVFLERGPLYLVAVSGGGEGEAALTLQLDLLYRQVLMILTSAVERPFARNPSYDVRSLLGGTDPILISLLHSFDSDPSPYLSASPSLPLLQPARQRLVAALASAAKGAGATYGVVFADGLLAAQVALSPATSRSAGGGGGGGVGGGGNGGADPLPPHDLLLLSNFVRATESFRQAEGSYSPVCLPGVNPRAFFHAYIRYLDAAQRLVMVLISGDAASFYNSGGASDSGGGPSSSSAQAGGGPGGGGQAGGGVGGAAAMLQEAGVLPALEEALEGIGGGRLSVCGLPERAGGGPPGGTPLLYAMYKSSALGQYTATRWADPLDDAESQQALVSTFGRMREILFRTKPGVQPHRTFFHATERWVLLAQVGTTGELYMALDPLATREAAQQLAAGLLSWAKAQGHMLFQQ